MCSTPPRARPGPPVPSFLGGITGGVVASVGAGARQAFQSKTTNPIATANHTPTTIQPSSYWMLPSMLCAMTSSRMLPLVWLNSHAYQNVTAIVTTRPATSTDGCSGTLFQEEGGQVPAGYQWRQDRCGHKRRVAGLQARQGDPFQPGCSPRAPVRRVDHAHRVP